MGFITSIGFLFFMNMPAPSLLLLKKSSLSLIFLLFGLGSLAASVDVRVAVSDLLVDSLRPVMEAHADAEAMNLEITGIGSLPALDMLRAQEIDLAVIARPLTARALEDTLRQIPLGHEVAVVVANRGNPLNDLSVRQLAGIFGAREELNLTQWRSVGVADLGSRSFSLGAVEEAQSMSLQIFLHTALASQTLRSSVLIRPLREFEASIASDTAAIGISNRLPSNNQLKVIAVSKASGEPAFSPNSENTYFEDYPLRMPYLIVFQDRVAERVAPVVRVLLSERAADALEARAVLPLPANVRQSLSLEISRR